MMKSIIAMTLLCTAAFAQEIYIPPYEPKIERNSQPYLCCGVGSVMIGVQGGVMHQSGKHGVDFRVGAGTILVGHGAGAHVNYLHFPNFGDGKTYVGAGLGACYQTVIFQNDGFHVGPNLTLGRKKVYPNGKIRIHDVNFLFPINPTNGNWFIPTVSVGWLF